MFDINEGWAARFESACLPTKSAQDGWQIDHRSEPGFVEPTLRILEGDPSTARVLIVAAPGAVGKSTFARALGERTRTVLVDLAKTEPLGGNFFVGGIANAFGFQALANVTNGSLGLVVDALDEAQMRSGSEGFAAGLLDLGKIVQQPDTLPATLFGRAAAAEEAWLVLVEAGLDVCLLEIEFFDDHRAIMYLKQKLAVLAATRPDMHSSYRKHREVFEKLALEIRGKLVETPGGNETRFAGYAPVLDAICSYSLDEDDQNPSARIATLSAAGPISLVNQIAAGILAREQSKVAAQLSQRDLPLAGQPELYTPEEQLGRIAATMMGAPMPNAPHITDPVVRKAYDEMIADFAPQHPFLDARGQASNAAFAAFVLVWAITTGNAPDQARRALRSNPTLGAGLYFELFVHWLESSAAPQFSLIDIGALYGSFLSQVRQGEQPTLEISGEPEDDFVEVSFEMLEPASEEARDHRSHGPFRAAAGDIAEFRGPIGGVRVVAPIAVILGDGRSASITAPVEIEASMLEIDASEVRIFKAVGRDDADTQLVTLSAHEASVANVERIVSHGAKFTVSFPGDRKYPWVDHAIEPIPAADERIAALRRRARRILTSFRSHSRGTLRRLAAKIDHVRMMKEGNLGPKLLSLLIQDGIIRSVEAGKFYELNPDQLASKFGMDYQALQQQRWTSEADGYLASV